MSAFAVRLLAVVVAIGLLGACSARRTANELAHAPQALRLVAHGDVEEPLPWRLPKANDLPMGSSHPNILTAVSFRM